MWLISIVTVTACPQIVRLDESKNGNRLQGSLHTQNAQERPSPSRSAWGLSNNKVETTNKTTASSLAGSTKVDELIPFYDGPPEGGKISTSMTKEV